MVPDLPSGAWQHPWLRTECLLRVMLGTRSNAATWPQVKANLREVLATRGRIRRAGWFN